VEKLGGIKNKLEGLKDVINMPQKFITYLETKTTQGIRALAKDKNYSNANELVSDLVHWVFISLVDDKNVAQRFKVRSKVAHFLPSIYHRKFNFDGIDLVIIKEVLFLKEMEEEVNTRSVYELVKPQLSVLSLPEVSEADIYERSTEAGYAYLGIAPIAATDRAQNEIARRKEARSSTTRTVAVTTGHDAYNKSLFERRYQEAVSDYRELSQKYSRIRGWIAPFKPVLTEAMDGLSHELNARYQRLIEEAKPYFDGSKPKGSLLMPLTADIKNFNIIAEQLRAYVETEEKWVIAQINAEIKNIDDGYINTIDHLREQFQFGFFPSVNN
jgi:hypothetical protein